MNLIGEHIDYVGLPVLPMALDREIRILFRAREDARVRASNPDPRFPDDGFDVGPEIPPAGAGAWGDYLRAACRAVAREYGVTRGMDALVLADLPPSAGLSSSSALVVAAALALLAENAETSLGFADSASRTELAEILADGERYTGTRGGGMDQAVCLLAREGHACRIDFDPLRATHLPIPREWTFVVVHSGQEARKSGPEQAAYNRRRTEVEEALGSGAGAVLPPTLARRLRHVTSEAARVDEACDAMREGDAGSFGRAMLESHRSLRDDFEVSTPRLDAMVEAAMAGGAYGARLTGAGFGGCAVALVGPEAATAVLEAMAAVGGGGVGMPAPSFVASPGRSAEVFPLGQG